ncbi:dual specificity protein kinase splA [Condylostylus longicornis]|uniref:dual specificity protein kinase splA n=1 Tax=Condylostylus longicornis TaxID=2530218 RepID=UPI00244DE886|nr:dual specificity protein kinase splA [Condylostylus longicornis]
MQRVARWFGFGGGGYVNTLNNISPERAKDSVIQQTSIQPQVTQQQQIQNLQTAEISTISQQVQQHHQQQQQKLQHQVQLNQKQQITQNQNEQQQQVPQASYYQPQYKENPLNSASGPYHYNRPKANCNPCNKIPWIPMWPGNIPILPGHIHNRPQLPSAFPSGTVNQFVTTPNPHTQNIPHSLGEPSSPIPSNQGQLYSQHFQRNPQHPFSSQFDNRPENQLRAVRFNNAISNLQLIPPPHLSIPPIPVPNLSAVPLPPLYNAQNFKDSGISSQESNNVPYIDHVEEPSELQPVTPTQVSPNNFNGQRQLSSQIYQQQPINFNNGQFEIIKSVPVADFISSIEYPVKLTESKIIDLSKDNRHSQSSDGFNKINYNKENETPKLIELGSIDNTNTYATEATTNIQHVSQPSNNLVSQSLLQSNKIQNTEFEKNDSTKQYFHEQSLRNQESHKTGNRQQSSHPEILSNFIQPPEQFDFVGPSTSLLPPIRTDPPDFLSSPIIVHNTHEPNDNYPEASSHNLTVKNENFLENNYIQGPTLLPELESIFTTTSSIPVHLFQDNLSVRPTEPAPSFDIIPSLETASEYPDLFKDYIQKTKQTTTQAPVLYNHNDDIFPGKPFTKDNDDTRNNNNITPWFLQPTPTSTYSSLDASGKYAGMSPPSEFQPPLIKFNEYTIDKRPKQIQQLIIPYTTKIKPRPFKLREQQIQQQRIQQQQLQEQQQIQQQQIQQQQIQQHQIHPLQGNKKQEDQQFPLQYENLDNRYSNWSSSHEHQEIHDQQESKLVPATQTTEEPTRKTTKYLTKILASNIRELLRREQAKRNKTTIDNNISDSSEANNLKHLQKNIDDWTEQEYTSLKHKASTVSIQKPSKNIPNEYLTTTQSYNDIENKEKIGATIQTPSTSTMSIMKPMRTSLMMNPKDDFMAHLEDNSVFNVVTNNKNRLEVYTKSYMKNRISTSTIPPISDNRTPFISSSTISPTSTSTMSPVVTTSTTTFRTSTSATPFYYRNAMHPTKPSSEKEPWQKLKVSISPLTNEKVYVVTPVPKFQTKSTTPIDGIGTFKSPRFIVRPAPVSNNNSNNTNSSIANNLESATETSNSIDQIEHMNTEKTFHKPYTPELFGLMGISAFVPDEPADILDGHSRVITVVTPTPHNKKRSIKYLELKRTTAARVLPLLTGNS